MFAKRRISLAIGASLAAHLLFAVGLVGSSLWRGWPTVPVDVEITGMRLEDLSELPLGAPPSGGSSSEHADPVVSPAPAPLTPSPKDAQSDPSRRKPRPKPAPDRNPKGADPDTEPGPARPRPTSVRSYAPEGSRVTALLRVDRLRDTPYAAAVDELLLNLPDRRDLLEGTDIELYRDIDALLIATPNPLDARVTFLAARHRLSDAAMRAALERGARATNRKLAWRTERGRPFAERRFAERRPRAASPATADAPATEAETYAAANRDRRLILLPAPHLVVVTPPAYRALILGGASGARPRAASPPDAGAGPSDAGAPPAAEGEGQGRDDWAALIRRIDAEDGIMPEDGVAMVSAVDLFSARSLRRTLDAVPGTRGSVDDAPPAAGATIMGLPVPRALTATVGVTPRPFADIDADFAADGDASAWEREWPALRRRLLGNPLVVLSGFSSLIGRATLTRAGATVHLRVDATELETIRILQLVAAQMPALRR